MSKPAAYESASGPAVAEPGPLEDKIRQQLVKSGERERLKQLLRDKLTECGWRDDIKQRCKEYITRRGRDNVTTEDIVRHVRPEGRAAVPDSVKAELLVSIKKFITALTSNQEKEPADQ